MLATVLVRFDTLLRCFVTENRHMEAPCGLWYWPLSGIACALAASSRISWLAEHNLEVEWPPMPMGAPDIGMLEAFVKWNATGAHSFDPEERVEPGSREVLAVAAVVVSKAAKGPRARSSSVGQRGAATVIVKRARSAIPRCAVDRTGSWATVRRKSSRWDEAQFAKKLGEESWKREQEELREQSRRSAAVTCIQRFGRGFVARLSIRGVRRGSGATEANRFPQAAIVQVEMQSSGKRVKTKKKSRKKAELKAEEELLRKAVMEADAEREVLRSTHSQVLEDLGKGPAGSCPEDHRLQVDFGNKGDYCATCDACLYALPIKVCVGKRCRFAVCAACVLRSRKHGVAATTEKEREKEKDKENGDRSP